MYFLPLSSPIRREGAFVLTLLRHFPLSDDRSHFRVVESGSPKKEGARGLISRATFNFFIKCPPEIFLLSLLFNRSRFGTATKEGGSERATVCVPPLTSQSIMGIHFFATFEA